MNNSDLTDEVLRETCEVALRFLAGLAERPVNQTHSLGDPPDSRHKAFGAKRRWPRCSPRTIRR